MYSADSRRAPKNPTAGSIPCPIEFVGVRDQFGASGEPEELAQHYGLTAPFIAQAARDAIARKKP